MPAVPTWRREEIPVLAVNYADALADPAATAARLARFLGQPFDAQAAAAAIEPSLRRQGATVPQATWAGSLLLHLPGAV
jgi:hypothetical protein